MDKRRYAQYLRQRHLKKAEELSNYLGMSVDQFIDMIKRTSDEEIINSYRTCSCCGYELISKIEMDSLIQRYDDPERIFDEIPSGHE